MLVGGAPFGKQPTSSLQAAYKQSKSTVATGTGSRLWSWGWTPETCPDCKGFLRTARLLAMGIRFELQKQRFALGVPFQGHPSSRQPVLALAKGSTTVGRRLQEDWDWAPGRKTESYHRRSGMATLTRRLAKNPRQCSDFANTQVKQVLYCKKMLQWEQIPLAKILFKK